MPRKPLAYTPDNEPRESGRPGGQQNAIPELRVNLTQKKASSPIKHEPNAGLEKMSKTKSQ